MVSPKSKIAWLMKNSTWCLWTTSKKEAILNIKTRTKTVPNTNNLQDTLCSHWRVLLPSNPLVRIQDSLSWWDCCFNYTIIKYNVVCPHKIGMKRIKFVRLYSILLLRSQIIHKLNRLPKWEIIYRMIRFKSYNWDSLMFAKTKVI